MEENDFTQKVLTCVLPTIKRMIEREEEFLKESKKKLGKEVQFMKKYDFNWKNFWRRPPSEELMSMYKTHIEHSEQMLESYKQSLKEYEDYALETW